MKGFRCITAACFLMIVSAFTTSAQKTILETSYHTKTHEKTTRSKASLVKRTILLPDGMLQFETRSYPQLELIERFIYKDSIPTGRWRSYNQTSDYDFELVYNSEDCGNHTGYNVITKRKSTMLASDSLSVPAIELINYEIAKEIRFPNLAKREYINGVTVLRFFIDPEGYIDAVTVYRSSGSGLLDKEAVRAVRELKKRPKPFIFNGEPVRGCILFAIKFSA